MQTSSTFLQLIVKQLDEVTFNISVTSPKNINNIIEKVFKNNFCMWFVECKCQEELIKYPYGGLAEYK